MKSYGGLWDGITSLGSLRAAMLRAARGKRHRKPVQRFLENAESELATLRAELRDGRWKPSPFVQFPVLDPKPRLISCAAFRDRVVHHSLCEAIGPKLESSFVFDSYACRVGKGSHAALFRARTMAARFAWFAKLDVKRYFDSIDHEILLDVLKPRFREKPLRNLIETIVRFPLAGQRPGKGIPIGNLTSQWFANIYLDGADHFALETLRVGSCIRYMDDMLLFDSSPERLSEHVREMAAWLRDRRNLEIKADRILVSPCRGGIPFLGWRVFPHGARLQTSRLRRSRGLIRRRQGEFVAGIMSEAELAGSVQASIAGIRAVRPGFRFDHWLGLDAIPAGLETCDRRAVGNKSA